MEVLLTATFSLKHVHLLKTPPTTFVDRNLQRALKTKAEEQGRAAPAFGALLTTFWTFSKPVYFQNKNIAQRNGGLRNNETDGVVFSILPGRYPALRKCQSSV